MPAERLEQYGNQFKVYYDDGTSDIAYQTQGSIWVIGDVGSGGGGGGGGDFSWPYPLFYVTSEFGPRSGRFHEGMDWSGGPATLGDPIPAIGDGTVEYAGGAGGTGFGNHVIIAHGTFGSYDLKSVYAHMLNLPPVSTGDSVTKGDIIGAVNNTGSSFGSHLHMETHKCAVGGSIIWNNADPSWTATRTAVNPRDFMVEYGDGAIIIS